MRVHVHSLKLYPLLVVLTIQFCFSQEQVEPYVQFEGGYSQCEVFYVRKYEKKGKDGDYKRLEELQFDMGEMWFVGYASATEFNPVSEKLPWPSIFQMEFSLSRIPFVEPIDDSLSQKSVLRRAAGEMFFNIPLELLRGVYVYPSFGIGLGYNFYSDLANKSQVYDIVFSSLSYGAVFDIKLQAFSLFVQYRRRIDIGNITGNSYTFTSHTWGGGIRWNIAFR